MQCRHAYQRNKHMCAYRRQTDFRACSALKQQGGAGEVRGWAAGSKAALLAANFYMLLCPKILCV